MKESPKLILVEDDISLGNITKELLEIDGFSVQLCKTAESAIGCLENEKYDLCLFDVKLPGMDGISLSRYIRSESIKIPIIFLTGITQIEEQINGIELDPYDYVGKPYLIKELVLRIRILLGRNGLLESVEIDNQTYYFSKYRFEFLKNELYYHGETHTLTSLEGRVLQMLVENRNRVVERRIILNKIWGHNSTFNAKCMDVVLSKLRRHFKGNPDTSIMNTSGIGFKLLTN